MSPDPNSEQALVIAEDTPEIKRRLKLIQSVFRDKDLSSHVVFLQARPFKSTRIIETVHFAEKKESPLLQIADICAFTIKRRLMRKPDVDEFYQAIEPQIVRTKETDADRKIDFILFQSALDSYLYRPG